MIDCPFRPSHPGESPCCRVAALLVVAGLTLAAELLHLPDEPAGVEERLTGRPPSSDRTASPAAQAGSGPPPSNPASVPSTWARWITSCGGIGLLRANPTL